MRTHAHARTRTHTHTHARAHSRTHALTHSLTPNPLFFFATVLSFAGELGGDAIINTLIGKNNPSGKMPYTTYHADFTARDVREMDLKADGGVTYRWFTGPVHAPFGAGLSYTTFTYEWADAAVAGAARAGRATSLPIAGGMRVDHTVTVTNTGTVEGDCVVLAFVLATTGSPADTPLKKMFDFERLRGMAPGERRTVTFWSDARVLGQVTQGGARVLQPGRLRVQVGDVLAPAARTLALTGSPMTVEANEWTSGLAK